MDLTWDARALIWVFPLLGGLTFALHLWEGALPQSLLSPGVVEGSDPREQHFPSPALLKLLGVGGVELEVSTLKAGSPTAPWLLQAQVVAVAPRREPGGGGCCSQLPELLSCSHSSWGWQDAGGPIQRLDSLFLGGCKCLQVALSPGELRLGLPLAATL